MCVRDKKRVIRVAFADKLKSICHDLFGWAGVKPAMYYENHPEAKNDFIEPLNKTVRDLWIEVGNRMREVYGPVWIDYALKNHMLLDYDFVFVPDLRYPNEFTALRNHLATLVKVERVGLPEPTDVADTALIGETRWHHVVKNDGDMHELYSKAMELYEVING